VETRGERAWGHYRGRKKRNLKSDGGTPNLGSCGVRRMVSHCRSPPRTEKNKRGIRTSPEFPHNMTGEREKRVRYNHKATRMRRRVAVRGKGGGGTFGKSACRARRLNPQKKERGVTMDAPGGVRATLVGKPALTKNVGQKEKAVWKKVSKRSLAVSVRVEGQDKISTLWWEANHYATKHPRGRAGPRNTARQGKKEVLQDHI